MPPWKSLAFAATSLSVAYRASAQPQSLELRVRLTDADSNGDGMSTLAQLLSNVACGAAGGAEFHPASSTASHASGPLRTGDPGAGAVEYRWVLTVSAISPAYIKNLVRRLALIGGSSNLPVWMKITGSLGLDDSSMSVSEAMVLPWLDDPWAWPRAWPSPPFEVVDVDVPTGAWLRMHFIDPTSIDTYKAFRARLYCWCSEVAYHAPAVEGEAGLMQVMPQMARNHTTLTARYREFHYVGSPARDVILNMLIRFHHEVCPIAKVELGFPS